MVFYPTLTTPFNRYNSSKRLPLLELGTGVSSNGIDLSTVVMSFNFSRTSKLDKLVCSGMVNDRPCAFTNCRLWVRDGIYRNRGYVENYFKYTLENVIQQDAKKILRPDPIQHLVRFQEFANLSLVKNPFTEFFDLNTGLIREWCT